MVSALVLSLALASPALVASAPGEPAAAGQTSDYRGRVVCLDPAGQRQACGPAARRFALETGDGKLHDVHYYCEVCNITAYAPGLCPCCRREMELKETPVP